MKLFVRTRAKECLSLRDLLICPLVLIAGSIPVLAQHTMAMHTAANSVSSDCTTGWSKPIQRFSRAEIGNLSHPTSTGNLAAQEYFNQGLMFYYGFDTVSAMQSFHMASVLDTTFAMSYWGVALAAGGDLNIPINDPCMALAISQARIASANLGTASKAEAFYIEAIRARYGLSSSPTPVDRDPAQLSVPYMLAMRKTYQALFLGPTRDPDAAALYAVSLMDLRPWLWWTTSGEPSAEITAALSVLRAGLGDPAFSHHIGLNHFYIHAMEEAPVSLAVTALPSAKMLMDLAPPRTPHLRHMPAHILLLSGQWSGVVQANTDAVAADQFWVDQCASKSYCNELLVGHYRSHDLLFLGVGLSNQGVWVKVRQAAEDTENNANKYIKSQPGLEHYLTTRAIMATHFAEWEYVRAIPRPSKSVDPRLANYCSVLAEPEQKPLALAMWYFAQTMADAATSAPVDEHLFAFNETAACATGGWGNNSASVILAVVHWRLLARIAESQHQPEESIEFARLAVQTEDLLNYDEPPGWYLSSRESLGAALFRSGYYAAAQTVFEADLRKHRNSSRSLYGRWQSLAKQGSPLAKQAQRDFSAQWLDPSPPNLDEM